MKVFCCNAGDKTEGLHVGEQRERRSAGSLPVMLIFKYIKIVCFLMPFSDILGFDFPLPPDPSA